MRVWLISPRDHRKGHRYARLHLFITFQVEQFTLSKWHTNNAHTTRQTMNAHSTQSSSISFISPLSTQHMRSSQFASRGINAWIFKAPREAQDHLSKWR
ncbi:hypothetical protein EYC84_007834 [Monilinia fructicola]|uniref:Uncharacterized protein n=1 Tax=Monilinia fructicola TaxID=38448 RepID=A0A5M9JPD1_MONFR|nr:hypothetical protein EYC84_007834 [Monilinia fructicola]